ncbi:hypothetical protein SAMN04488074_110189 [Lentzea albidocapillata subsp. violacea]|uniref:NACHT domain-containing protein n=1 Tax=Lentzea albidocapillata subsp. violacea TaxID=128104 RepID=A0A1G9JA58_9PSEU|nr:hypothetical protein SAMN04488074_110189 [Lentzea albidocapillata subsp. violacea]
MRAATEWLASHAEEDALARSLADLAAAELAKPYQRAKLDTLVQHIGHQVTEQLAPVLERFADDDVAASLTAVEEALSSVDLSDEALLSDDADPEVLAQRIRGSVPRQDLGRCYEIALDQSCRYLVQIIRNLPSFQPRALAEVLSRATAQTALLEDALSRLPRTSLHAPQGADNDDEFRDEYLRYITVSLDRLELLGLSVKDRPRLALSVAYLSLTVSGQERLRHGWFGEADQQSHSGVRVESALVSRTFVRGEAGSGKTTLLDWIAVTAARGGFVGDLRSWNGLIPFPIRLRAYADSPMPAKPEEFVTGWLAGIMPAGWVHRVLREGRGTAAGRRRGRGTAVEAPPRPRVAARTPAHLPPGAGRGDGTPCRGGQEVVGGAEFLVNGPATDESGRREDLPPAVARGGRCAGGGPASAGQPTRQPSASAFPGFLTVAAARPGLAADPGRAQSAADLEGARARSPQDPLDAERGRGDGRCCHTPAGTQRSHPRTRPGPGRLRAPDLSGVPGRSKRGSTSIAGVTRKRCCRTHRWTTAAPGSRPSG